MPLFRFLHSIGEISREDVQSLRRRAHEDSLHPIEALAAEMDPERVAELITAHLGLPLIDLASATVEPKVLRTVSRELAARYDVFPVRRRDDVLTLAMANPLDRESLRAIQFATRVRIEPAVASLTQIRETIRRNYFLQEELESFLATSENRDRLDVIAATSLDDHDVDEDVEQKATVVRLVEMLLLDGLHLGASDVHIEPARDAVNVRYRVNGVLEPGMTLPKQLNAQIVSRIKIMAQLDITERRRPQDGAMRLTHQGRQVDVRVSVLPTKTGEKIVLRLLVPEAEKPRLDAMGLDPAGVEILRTESRRPEGLILISGPTGSGKSTTAHGMLSGISDARLNIVTIENPIERRLPGVTQVEINEKQGVTFAGTLRSILRQDPDVIFVGEIRDEETAKIALQAAQTGHLVITTVHTIDASSSITRLLDLGLDPLLISGSLRLAVAQRLVRVGCPACRTTSHAPTAIERARLERYECQPRSITGVGGCSRCRGTGYTGRTGIFEVLPISRGVRAAIERRAPETEIRALVRHEGVESMSAAAIRALDDGRTTIDEILRVIPPEEVPATREAAAPLPPGRPDRFRVLVVDDDHTVATLTGSILEKASLPIDATLAFDAEQAIDELARAPHHLVLLDISMPRSSGFEVCARIRASARTHDLPIFMLTGRDDDDAKVEAFRAGADDYLVKPIRPRELIARLGRAFDRQYGGTSDDDAPLLPPGAPPAQDGSARPPLPGLSAPAPWADRPAPTRTDAWKRFLGEASS